MDPMAQPRKKDPMAQTRGETPAYAYIMRADGTASLEAGSSCPLMGWPTFPGTSPRVHLPGYTIPLWQTSCTRLGLESQDGLMGLK